MISCPKCGKSNTDDALFCTRCGAPVKPNAASSTKHRVDYSSKSFENWYDSAFGIFGPVIASFLFLIVLRLAIEAVRITGVEILEMAEITSVLLLYLLPLFCITLLSNYTSYFARHSEQFRIFSPLFHSIIVVLFLWIVTQILRTLQDRLQNADLGTAATTIENALPTIFIFVLLIGYMVLALTMSKEQQKKP
jgi:hypothetical protein